MSKYKMVNFKIMVPVGDRCYSYDGTGNADTHCEFFDNEGGHPHCKMGFNFPHIHDIGKNAGKKSPECAMLMED